MEAPPGGSAPDPGPDPSPDPGPDPAPASDGQHDGGQDTLAPAAEAPAVDPAPEAPSVPAPTGGHPPPSPLSGGYLLIVIGEPHSAEHRDLILQRVAKGFLSWDSSDCHVDLEKELSTLGSLAPKGEEARNGERLVQYASESLVTEVLVHPQVNTLLQCVRNLLSSFTRHRHILHAGYTFAGTGSWILQDGTFSFADLNELFHEPDVQRVLRAYENSVSVDIHCCAEGPWKDASIAPQPFSRFCRVRVNPSDVLTAGSSAITSFIDYVGGFVKPAVLESLLEPSDVVGNIRFSHPTLYVFPGGQGDAALFGINGFNMLVDGGFGRKSCFWDFARHLDRLDAVLLTRLNNANAHGLASLLQRKRNAHVYPQIGHFFCNLQDRKVVTSPDGDKDRDNLLVSLVEEGQEMVLNLRHLQLKPSPCYRDSVVEPVNLYHKVGHGKLDMYVVSPARDSREVKEFLARWSASDAKLFASHLKKDSRDFQFPLQNMVSICALLVWQPANPQDTITRILFPGSTPQVKIFEGLDKIRHLDYLKHPICTAKSLSPSSSIIGISAKAQNRKYIPTVLDKINPGEQQKTYTRTVVTSDTSKHHILKAATIPVAGGVSDTKVYRTSTTVSSAFSSNKSHVSNRKIEKSQKSEPEKTEKNEKLDEIEITDKDVTSENNENGNKKENVLCDEKAKDSVKVKSKSRQASHSRERKSFKGQSTEKKEIDRKEKKDEKKEDRTSPTTPKKINEIKANGISSRSESVTRVSNRSSSKVRRSPSATPAKSAKEANNRKVAAVTETKVQSRSVSTTRTAVPKPAKKEDLNETVAKAKLLEKQTITKRSKPPSPIKNIKKQASPAKTQIKVTGKSDRTVSVRKSRASEKDDRADENKSNLNASKDVSVNVLTKNEAVIGSGIAVESKKLVDNDGKLIDNDVRKDNMSSQETYKDVAENISSSAQAQIVNDKTSVELPSTLGAEPDEEEDEYLVIEKEEPCTEESFQEQISAESHAPLNMSDQGLSDEDDAEDEKLKRDTQESEKNKDFLEKHRKKSEPKLTMQLTDKEHAAEIARTSTEEMAKLERRRSTHSAETIVTTQEELSPSKKEKIEEEVEGIITSATEFVSKKEDLSSVESEDSRKEKDDVKVDDELKINNEVKLDVKPKDNLDEDHKVSEAKQTSGEYKEESQPDEKISTTGESGATTAPTLPEDERIPLDEIKEVIEEKHILEETKEKERVEEDTVPEAVHTGRPGHFEIHRSSIPALHRDMIKTPDEVADLPVDEVYDPTSYSKEEQCKDTKEEFQTSRKSSVEQDMMYKDQDKIQLMSVTQASHEAKEVKVLKNTEEMHQKPVEGTAEEISSVSATEIKQEGSRRSSLTSITSKDGGSREDSGEIIGKATRRSSIAYQQDEIASSIPKDIGSRKSSMTSANVVLQENSMTTKEEEIQGISIPEDIVKKSSITPTEVILASAIQNQIESSQNSAILRDVMSASCIEETGKDEAEKVSENLSEENTAKDESKEPEKDVNTAEIDSNLKTIQNVSKEILAPAKDNGICVSLEELRILGHEVEDIKPSVIKRDDTKYSDIEPGELHEASSVCKEPGLKPASIHIPTSAEDKEDLPDATTTTDDESNLNDTASSTAGTGAPEPLEAVQEDVYLESSIEEEPVYGQTDEPTLPEYVTVTPDSSPEGCKSPSVKRKSISEKVGSRKSSSVEKCSSDEVKDRTEEASDDLHHAQKTAALSDGLALNTVQPQLDTDESEFKLVGEESKVESLPDDELNQIRISTESITAQGDNLAPGMHSESAHDPTETIEFKTLSRESLFVADEETKRTSQSPKEYLDSSSDEGKEAELEKTNLLPKESEIENKISEDISPENILSCTGHTSMIGDSAGKAMSQVTENIDKDASATQPPGYMSSEAKDQHKLSQILVGEKSEDFSTHEYSMISTSGEGGHVLEEKSGLDHDQLSETVSVAHVTKMSEFNETTAMELPALRVTEKVPESIAPISSSKVTTVGYATEDKDTSAGGEEQNHETMCSLDSEVCSSKGLASGLLAVTSGDASESLQATETEPATQVPLKLSSNLTSQEGQESKLKSESEEKPIEANQSSSWLPEDSNQLESLKNLKESSSVPAAETSPTISPSASFVGEMKTLQNVLSLSNAETTSSVSSQEVSAIADPLSFQSSQPTSVSTLTEVQSEMLVRRPSLSSPTSKTASSTSQAINESAVKASDLDIASPAETFKTTEESATFSSEAGSSTCSGKPEDQSTTSGLRDLTDMSSVVVITSNAPLSPPALSSGQSVAQDHATSTSTLLVSASSSSPVNLDMHHSTDCKMSDIGAREEDTPISESIIFDSATAKEHQEDEHHQGQDTKGTKEIVVGTPVKSVSESFTTSSTYTAGQSVSSISASIETLKSDRFSIGRENSEDTISSTQQSVEVQQELRNAVERSPEDACPRESSLSSFVKETQESCARKPSLSEGTKESAESMKLQKEVEDSEKTKQTEKRVPCSEPVSDCTSDELVLRNKTGEAASGLNDVQKDFPGEFDSAASGSDNSYSVDKTVFSSEKGSSLEEERKSGATTPTILVTSCKTLARQSQPSESDTDITEEDSQRRIDDVFEAPKVLKSSEMVLDSEDVKADVHNVTLKHNETDSRENEFISSYIVGEQASETSKTVSLKADAQIESDEEGIAESVESLTASAADRTKVESLGIVREFIQVEMKSHTDEMLNRLSDDTAARKHETVSSVTHGAPSLETAVSATVQPIIAAVSVQKTEAATSPMTPLDPVGKTSTSTSSHDFSADIVQMAHESQFTPVEIRESATTNVLDSIPNNVSASRELNEIQGTEATVQSKQVESEDEKASKSTQFVNVEADLKEAPNIGSVEILREIQKDEALAESDEPEFTLVSKSVHEEYISVPSGDIDGDCKKLAATTTISTFTAKDGSDSPHQGEITKTVTTVTKVTTGEDGTDAMETTTTEKVQSEGKVTSVTTKTETSPMHKNSEPEPDDSISIGDISDTSTATSAGLNIDGSSSVPDAARILLESAVVSVVEGVASVSRNATAGYDDAMTAGISLLSSVIGVRKDSLDATRSCTPGSDIEVEPSTPRSDLSSGQVSRAPTNISECEYNQGSDEEDAPGSPTSLTSQITHSPPPPHFDFEIGDPHRTIVGHSGTRDDQCMSEPRLSIPQIRRQTIAAPMTSTVYGGVPADTFETSVERSGSHSKHDVSLMTSSISSSCTDNAKTEMSSEKVLEDVMSCSVIGELNTVTTVEFDQAVEEHRAARGADLTRSTEHIEVMPYSVESTVMTTNESSCLEEKKESQKELTEGSKPDSLSIEKNAPSVEASTATRTDPIADWGKPLGLPSPVAPTANSTEEPVPSPKGTPQKERLGNRKTVIDNKKRPESPRRGNKASKTTPIYIDLTYVPHHGNSYYTSLEFFKRVRARYYVFSGIEPSRDVYNALLEAKQSWEDKDLEVTIIPTYDTDTLGYWVAENEDALAKYKIDLSPSASRCTINLQDHETSCSAYRLEF